MLSDFKEEERKDGMIAKNDASSDDESAHRCDNSVECSIVNATYAEFRAMPRKRIAAKTRARNVESASCKLGTGGVVCPSVENCEKQIVRRQHADCKLGTGGVVCPSVKVDAIDAKNNALVASLASAERCALMRL